jgi:hypothetical protein
MCRALHTLHHGTIVSKPAAARWAQEALREKWTELIEPALAWRPGLPFDHLNDTLVSIQFTLNQYRNSQE